MVFTHRKTTFDYDAKISRIIDGDSLELIIDEGFKHSWKVSCRMKNINAFELTSSDPAERARAQEAKAFLANRLPVGSLVYIISRNLDKYGRPEIDLWFEDVNINSLMVEKGHAAEY